MGIITISVNDEDEANIRKLAESRYGHKKGAISKVIAEAVHHDLIQSDDTKKRKHALELLEKGLHLGGKMFNRDDLYDRN